MTAFGPADMIRRRVRARVARGVVVAAVGALILAGLSFVTPTAADAADAWCPRSPLPGPGGQLIIGTSRSETLVGTPGDDVICGGPGADRIEGRGGNDRIYGGPGDDQITSGAGNDWIQGGGGNDLILARGGDDVIYGDAGPAYQEEPDAAKLTGADVIYAGTGADVVYAGPGNDIVYAGGVGEGKRVLSDSVYGDAGNDVIMSDIRHSTYSDQFFGGSGDDLIMPNPLRLSPLGNVVWGGKGNDTIITVNVLQDGVNMDEPKGVQVPVGKTGCTVTIPSFATHPSAARAPWSASCPSERTYPACPGRPRSRRRWALKTR